MKNLLERLSGESNGPVGNPLSSRIQIYCVVSNTIWAVFNRMRESFEKCDTISHLICRLDRITFNYRVSQSNILGPNDPGNATIKLDTV